MKEKLMMMSKTKKKIIIFLICLFISFVLMNLCSLNSFLCSYNYHYDFQWYVTMGNGILNGKVPYKDLFEQKGPVVYFVFAFLCLFGNVSLADFVLEVICFSLFLYFSYCILKRKTDTIFSVLAIILLGLIVVISDSFVKNSGGSVEEYILPIISWLILKFIEFFEDGKQLTRIQAVLIGIFVALMFWSKFTCIFVPALLIVFWFAVCIKNKNIRQCLILCLFMVFGFAIITISVIIYFLVNGALYDLFYCYFYVNIFLYDFGQNFLKLAIEEWFIKFSFTSFIKILLFVLMLVCSIFYVVKNKKSVWIIATGMLQFLIFLIMQTCLYYYYLILYPFLIFDFMVIYIFFDKRKNVFKSYIKGLECCLIIYYSICASFVALNNASYKLSDQEEYQVVKEIQNYESDEISVYCYNVSATMFYNLLGVTPDEKFYVKNNISYEAFPEMYEYMEDVIRAQSNFFVITEVSTLKNEQEFLLEYYEVYKTYDSYVLLIKSQ